MFPWDRLPACRNSSRSDKRTFAPVARRVSDGIGMNRCATNPCEDRGTPRCRVRRQRITPPSRRCFFRTTGASSTETRSVSERPRSPRRSRIPRNPRGVPRSRVGFPKITDRRGNRKISAKREQHASCCSATRTLKAVSGRTAALHSRANIPAASLRSSS